MSTLVPAAVACAAVAVATGPALTAQAAPVNSTLASALPGASAAFARTQAAQDNVNAQLAQWARTRVEVAQHAAQQAARAAAARQLAEKRAAARRAKAAAAASQPLTSGMSGFEQCVAWRESSDTPTDPDGLFGILPSTWASLGYSGTAGEASVAQQKVAFSRLYAMYGSQPWAPSDGC
jgi:hypothetical protein